jgi:hypothetical protein
MNTNKIKWRGVPLPIFGTKGLLAASVWHENDEDIRMGLSPAQPEITTRGMQLRFDHNEPFTSGSSAILRARLTITNDSSVELSLVAGFETGLRPSLSTCLEQLYFPLTALGSCPHPALAQFGENHQVESLRPTPGPGERIAAHYLEPLGSEPRQLTTKIPLLIPLITQLNPQAPAAVSLFASPELPWAAIREGSEQGESFWRLQTRVRLEPGSSCTLEVFLAVHEPEPAAAWPLFHRHAAPADPAPVGWLQHAKVHYFDFLSPEASDGPRGRGFFADAEHFDAFGVGLATQHGYYPYWGDYIHPNRPLWRGMPADVHGGFEMSLDEMRARIALARRHGGRAGVYIHLVGFDDASPLWAQLRQGCRIGEEGNPVPFVWKGPDVFGDSRFMSISSSIWSKHLLEQARWIFELLDPDAIVVDETFGGLGYDYISGSAQPSSPSAIQFFKDLRALARSFGPDKAILTSDCGLSSFVLWADGEGGDHAYPTLLGHEEYRREPVRYIAALGSKRWLPCAWLWQGLWKDQLDLARKTGAGIGVANGWLDYAGLAGLSPAARESYLDDLTNLRAAP